MFWRKKITSDEYADLNAKIIKLSTDVLILQATVEKMEIRIKSYHSKLSRMKDDEEEQQEQPMDMQELQRRLMGMQ